MTRPGRSRRRCSPRTSAAARARRARACSSRQAAAPPPASKRPTLSLPRSGRKGRARFRVTCDSACLGNAKLTISRATARKLKLKAPHGRDAAVPVQPRADGFRDDQALQVHPAQDATGEHARAERPAAGAGDRPRGPEAVGDADGVDPAELRCLGAGGVLETRRSTGVRVLTYRMIGKRAPGRHNGPE